MKFYETKIEEEKKTYFFLISIFCVFSILIKLSSFPVIFYPLYIYFHNFNNFKFLIIKFKYFFIFLLFLIFFLQQFIFTGCIFFPNEFTCFNTSWFNSEYLNLSKQLELTNKSYYHKAKEIYSPDQYLVDLNWLNFWIKRNFIEISEHVLTILMPSIIFILLLKKNDELIFSFKEKYTLYVFLLIGFVFWLSFSPVYRFAIHLFVTLIFVFLSGFFLSKKFSKNVFITMVVLFVFFSFFKNLLRLNEVDNIYLGIQKINNNYVSNNKISSQLVKIYTPDVENNSRNGWQGRLCWDIPFICSYNKLKVYRKKGYLIINKLKE